MPVCSYAKKNIFTKAMCVVFNGDMDICLIETDRTFTTTFSAFRFYRGGKEF